MKNVISLMMVASFVLAALSPAISVSGETQGPTIEWKVTLPTKAYPGDPTTPLVTDLDNDGTMELILTSGDSLYVLRSKGTTKWRYALDGTFTGAMAGDIDANSDKEIVAVTESGTVHAFSRDGAHIWAVEAGGSVRGPPSFADLDGNGRLEIYVGTSKGDLVILDDKGTLIKKAPVGSPIIEPVITIPTRVQGGLALIAATPSSIIGADKDGNALWNHSMAFAPTGEMAVGDLDMDSVLEVIVPTAKALEAVHCSNGTLAWSGDLLADGATPAPILADLDRDGYLEAIGANGVSDIVQLGPNGSQGWVATLNSAVAGMAAVSAPDAAIIVTTKGGQLAELNASGIKQWHKELGITISRSASIVDIDKDSEMEIIVVGTDGTVLLLNTHQVLKSPWPMVGHDMHNTRSMASTENGDVPWAKKWVWAPQMAGVDWTVVTDVDGDGKDEIFCQAQYGGMDIIRGDGKATEHSELSEISFVGPLAAELNGDGGTELVVTTKNTVQARSRLLAQIWNYSLPDVLSTAAGDINSDGLSEVFAGNQSGKVVALKPADGAPLWTDMSSTGISSLTVADLSSDGIYELIEARIQPGSTMTVRNATDGAVLWSSGSYLYDVVDPTIGDFDGDGKADIIMGVYTGDLVAFSGNGTIRWARTVPGAVLRTIAMGADVSGQDVAVTLWSGDILVIDGKDGTIIRSIDYINSASVGNVPAAVFLGTSAPVAVGFADFKNIPDDETFFWTDGTDDTPHEIPLEGPGTNINFGDIDGDGLIEMVQGRGKISAYELGIGPGPTVPWSMGGHDAERTFNPFAKAGRVLPDLTIGPEDIVFDPQVVNEAGTVNLTVTYHNMGPILTGEFNITISKDGAKINTFRAQSMAPFSDSSVSYKLPMGYANATIEVELDGPHEVQELRETDNKATRTLFRNILPVAEAGPDARADPKVPVIFDGGQSKDLDGDIVKFEWDFNDGSKSSGLVVTHAFDKSGTYTVQLKVTDEYGAQGYDNRTIRINHPPAFQSWDPKGNASVNEGEHIYFRVVTDDSDGDKVTLTWHLDGKQVAQGQGWSWWADYSSSGTHTVLVSASDGSLTTNLTWKLTVIESMRLIEEATPPSPVTISEGASQTFHLKLTMAAEGADIDWFLDGTLVQSNTSTFSIYAGAGTQGKHTLNVQVRDLTVSDFHDWNITIGPRVDVPDIRWYYPEQREVKTSYKTPVYFGIAAEGGTIQWYINGMAQVGQNGQSFKFDIWGNLSYNITATVSSETSSVSRHWNLTIEYPPIANIGASALNVRPGRNVVLDGQKSKAYRSGDAIQSYRWDFGDGQKQEGSLVKHSFKKAGSYKVTLTVTDTRGLSSTASVIVVVIPETQQSTPGFEGALLVFAAAIGAAALSLRRRSLE